VVEAQQEPWASRSLQPAQPELFASKPARRRTVTYCFADGRPPLESRSMSSSIVMWLIVVWAVAGCWLMVFARTDDGRTPR